METYIVRIYRFQKDNPRHLVGIVESVESDRREKRAFSNIDDLWEILNSQMPELDGQNQEGAVKGVSPSAPPYPLEIPRRPTMGVIVDTRKLAKEDRILMIRNAIKKVSIGEIVALVDDDIAREDIAQAVKNHGWVLKRIEFRGGSYWITITPPLLFHP